MKKPNARRQFLATSATLASGIALGLPKAISAPNILRSYGKVNSVINGVQIGVITYSFRSMPDQSAEATLKYILDSGISATELMGGPAESFAGMPENPVDRRKFYRLARSNRAGDLTEDQEKEFAEMSEQMEAYRLQLAEWRQNVPMTKFEEVKSMYADAGVTIYGFKPSAFGRNNTDAEMDYGFRAAKALGASHVTLEHPSDDAHTQKLGKMAAKHKIYVAYHGHTQQTPTFWDTALEQAEYNAMNPDVGHYIAAGNTDVLQLLKKYNKRIKSAHVKDRKDKANGQDNMPWGQGDTPIPDILQLMSKRGYQFPATVELEYQIPEGSNAVKEVQNCLEFCRKSLAT